MAGKTNLTATLFSQKKLLAKSQTGVHRADNQEPIPSGLQVAAQSIFSQNIPSAPTQTLYTVQSASLGDAATIEYVDFTLEAVTGSVYDANDFDPDAQVQASGPHTYRLMLTGSYETLSNNSKKGTGYFVDNQILHWSLGGLQLVPPTFSNEAPNPYILNIYSGTNDVDDQIPILDELDWQIDYYSGLLFIQDYDASKLPNRARGFIYVGDMLSASLGNSGGSGTGVGWVGSGAGSISTTGSLLIGTADAASSNADTYFSSIGAAIFNEQGRNADFRVEGTAKTHALFVDASENQVLVLSGGASSSTDEAAGSDVNFYISGTVGGKDGSSRAISVFGGDLHISGNLTVNGTSPGGGGSGTGVGWSAAGVNIISSTGSVGLGTNTPTHTLSVVGAVSASLGLSGSLTQLVDGTSYLIAGSNVTITSASNGAVTIASSGGGGGSGSSFFTSPAAGKINTTGSAVFAGGGLGPSYVATSVGTDTFWFVSGSIDSRGSAVTGSAVFGGDVVISGTLSVNRSDAGGYSMVTVTTDGKVGIGTDNPGNKLSVGGNMDLGEYLYHKNDQDTFMRFENDQITFSAGSETLFTIKEHSQDIVTVGDGGDVDFQVKTVGDDNTLFVQGSTDRVGIGLNGPATTLHVKDSNPGIRIQREANTETSTLDFAGADGNVASSIAHGADTNDLIFSVFKGSGVEEILRVGDRHGSSNNRQVIVLSGSGMHAGAMQPKECDDIAFFVSGTIGSIGTTSKGAAVFGGDAVISGSLHGGSIIPLDDNLYNLGSPSHRFANIYTGDLHLRNERGHWQIIEEADFLTVVNRLTGKRYKMMLEPMEDDND